MKVRWRRWRAAALALVFAGVWSACTLTAVDDAELTGGESEAGAAGTAGATPVGGTAGDGGSGTPTGGSAGTPTGGNAGTGGSAGSPPSGGTAGDAAAGGQPSGGSAGSAGAAGGSADLLLTDLAVAYEAQTLTETTALDTWPTSNPGGVPLLQGDPASRPQVATAAGLTRVVFDDGELTDAQEDIMLANGAVALDGRGLTLFTVLAFADRADFPSRADVVRLEAVSPLILSRSLQSEMVYRQGSTVLYTPEGIAPLGQLVLTTVVHEAGGAVTIRVNGLQQQLGMIPITATQTIDLDLGSRDFRGEIAAVLVYSRALDSAEVTSVESYLQSVWACCD